MVDEDSIPKYCLIKSLYKYNGSIQSVELILRWDLNCSEKFKIL